MKEYKNTTKTKMNLFSRIADSIYQQGYEDGQAATPFTDTEEAEKKAYNRGLNEAWETAKKIVNMSEDEFDAVFDDVEYFEAAFESTPQETIAKIKAYEDKQNNHKEIMDFCENMGYSLDELAEVLKGMRGAENDE